METRAPYVVIGAFVLIVIAAGFFAILFFGQQGTAYDEYDVVFRERVSGLSKGAPVRFNGVQKGEVLELKIDRENPTVVIARVRVEDDTPIKEDTKAELELVGFTGLAIIQFVGGSANKPDLVDEVRGIPRIEADTSGFAAILEGSSDIIAAASVALSDENIAAISNTLASIDKIASVIASKDAEIGRTIDNAAATTESLAKITDELAKVADSLGALIDEDAPETLAEIRALSADARVLVAELNEMAQENREPIAVFTEQGLAQVGPAVAEARRLFRTLDQVLREMDRDPRGYLLGDPTPRYEGAEQ
jgi:phospholipid/cholesterol/gamma-HCH transport system substrate-binding protein